MGGGEIEQQLLYGSGMGILLQILYAPDLQYTNVSYTFRLLQDYFKDAKRPCEVCMFTHIILTDHMLC